VNQKVTQTLQDKPSKEKPLSSSEAFHRARLVFLKARDNNTTPFSNVPKNVIEKMKK